MMETISLFLEIGRKDTKNLLACESEFEKS